MRNHATMGERGKELNSTIGARVQKAREARGMTRKALAELVGLSEGQALYKYERGDRGFSTNQLKRLAEVLECSIDWIVFGRERGEEDPSEGFSSAKPDEGQLGLLGIRLSSDPTLPQPILDLINLGWVSPVTNDDIYHLRIHLGAGGSPRPLDLLVAVHAHRLQVDGTDENLRALNEANRRRAEALGGKRLVESEPPAPPVERAKSLPRSRRRTKTTD